MDDYRATWYTQLENKYLGDMNGAFLSIGRNSTLYINDTLFSGGRGVYGGCISIQGTSQAQIGNSSFTSCVSLLGGAIYAVNFDSLVIENCKFSENVAFRGYGQNIYSQNSKLNLTLRNNQFFSYHNSVFLRDGRLLVMENNVFKSEKLRVATIPY